jgi:hypothetical protein
MEDTRYIESLTPSKENIMKSNYDLVKELQLYVVVAQCKGVDKSAVVGHVQGMLVYLNMSNDPRALVDSVW